VRRPPVEAAARVRPADPATSVMTDLRQVPALLVDPEVDIEAAMRSMVRRNVRSLFVVNVDNESLGLITATDLPGEKPIQHLARYAGRRSGAVWRQPACCSVRRLAASQTSQAAR